MRMSNFTYDVFISYSHRDVEWVESWLLPRLVAAGVRVCIDSRNFKFGVPSLDNMTDAATRSRKTLFVMTPNWTVSEFSQFEALITQTIDPIGRQGRLLPLLLKDCDLPARLQILTYADFRNPLNHDTELARVIDALREPPPPALTNPPADALALNFVHPYLLQANFTGRVAERRELTAWLADDTQPVCALVAMGGMGKSALAWYWLKYDLLPSAASADVSAVDGVMWWSFYEGESSFAKFIDDALRYVTQQPIDASRFPTTYDRAQELQRHLQTTRILFVLDGFERQLRAYARLDAVYQPDDATTNPSREERACVDPTAARLLANIVAGTTRAKLLITSRLMVSDLEDRAGDALSGVIQRDLKELPRDDAVKFVRAQGVKQGTFSEIDAACAAYGYHPLSLRLLSGLIARDARLPGDIAAAPRHDVHANLVQRQHHVLEHSYNALPKRERALLSRIAAFRNPTTYDALLIFNTLGNEANFDAALDDLRVRGLLQHDTAHNRYDLHPIVRRYAYDRLTDKKGVHTRLLEYFAQIPALDENAVQSVEDLAPAIELYHHTLRAGRYDKAIELFRDRLHRLLYYRFGAYQTQIELLRGLFSDGEARAPKLKDENAQGWAMSALANSYSFSGQPQRAMPLFKMTIDIYENRTSTKEYLAIGLSNIALMAQVLLGELAASERALLRQIELCREIGDEFKEAVGHAGLGWLLSFRGEFSKSSSELNVAQDVFDRIKGTNYSSLLHALRVLRALLMGEPQAALEAAQEALHRASNLNFGGVERNIIRAEWLLGAALVMEGKDLSAASMHLTNALTRCRRINLVEVEPDILLAWARLFRARGDAQEEARAYAEEALVIADRCAYRLAQAEIHNFLARLALERGDRAAAREHAETARERAWCDGPPHCYKPALEEAEAMLKELG